MIKWFKNLFKKSDIKKSDIKKCKCANRQTFCLDNNICFVKCTDCGNSSMPWEVSEKIGKAFRESRPNQYKQLVDIDERSIAAGYKK